MLHKTRVSAIALAGALVLLTGCTSDGQFAVLGYTTRPTYNPSIRTVYVPIFGNNTYIRGIEFETTKAVIRDIEAKTPFKVVSSREEADTELLGKITVRTKGVNNINQLGEVRDVQLGLIAEVKWIDVHTGKPLSVANGLRLPDQGADVRGDPVLPGDGGVRDAAAREAAAKKSNLGWVQITPSAQYIPELGGTTASAQDLLVRQIARQIVHMMEVWNNCGQ